MIQLRLALVTDGAIAHSAANRDNYDYSEDFRELENELIACTSESRKNVIFERDNEAGCLNVMFVRLCEMTPGINRACHYNGWVTGVEILMKSDVTKNIYHPYYIRETKMLRYGVKHKDGENYTAIHMPWTTATFVAEWLNNGETCPALTSFLEEYKAR